MKIWHPKQKIPTTKNLSSQVFGAVRVNFWGWILTKTPHFVNRRSDLFRKFLGRLRMILCYWKSFLGPQKNWPERLSYRYRRSTSTGWSGGGSWLSKRGLSEVREELCKGGASRMRAGGLRQQWVTDWGKLIRKVWWTWREFFWGGALNPYILNQDISKWHCSAHGAV